MRNISLLLLILTIYIVSAQRDLKSLSHPLDTRICSAKEKYPGYCHLSHEPVCGVYINSYGQQVKKTFINRCFACKNSKIKYIYPGECSIYPHNSHFCIPTSAPVTLCPKIYKPVCGYFGQNIQCLVPPCATTGSNSCMTCLNQSVVYYLPGVCPTFGRK